MGIVMGFAGILLCLVGGFGSIGATLFGVITLNMVCENISGRRFFEEKAVKNVLTGILITALCLFIAMIGFRFCDKAFNAYNLTNTHRQACGFPRQKYMTQETQKRAFTAGQSLW